jgi:hypothetical protein
MHGDPDENFSCCGTFTIRSPDGRVVRRLPQRLSYLQRFAWSLDGRTLIGRGRDVKGRWGTYRVDVETVSLRASVTDSCIGRASHLLTGR